MIATRTPVSIPSGARRVGTPSAPRVTAVDLVLRWLYFQRAVWFDNPILVRDLENIGKGAVCFAPSSCAPWRWPQQPSPCFSSPDPHPWTPSGRPRSPRRPSDRRAHRPDGLGLLEQLRREDRLRRHQAAGRRVRRLGPPRGRLQVHQHRRGLVAGHPRQRGQHHRRHQRVARRDERHRRLHPQQGPQGRHLHRRGRERLRLLLPDGPPRRREHRQRGPLRPGHAPVLAVGLRLREGRLVRRRRRGTRRGDRVQGDQRLGHQGHRHHGPRADPLDLQLGLPEPLELGPRPRPHVPDEHGHHLLRQLTVDDEHALQLRPGPAPGRPAHRLLQRPRYADGRHARPHRRPEPHPHGALGDLRRPPSS